jgi:hypothetical protein
MSRGGARTGDLGGQDVNDDELAAHVAQVLEIDHQYAIRTQADATEQIARIRRAGRRAGRVLGWKVRTFVRDREDGGSVVGVVVVESTPEDEARLRERGDLLLDGA